MTQTSVLIDTDIAIGLPERDVDDGLALVMAANSPQLSITAVTLTYGNSTLDNVQSAMRNLNTHLQIPPASIALGARSEDDLGKTTEAVDLIISCLEGKSHSVIALGPLTNIATVVKLKPELVSKIDRIVMVASRRPGHRFLTGNYPYSHPDLNFEKDPEAVSVLISSGIPLVFTPFELSKKIWITQQILELVKANNTATAQFLYDSCLPWLELWKRRFSTAFLPVNGFNPFDCLAIAWFTDWDLLTHEEVQVAVEKSDYDTTDKTVQGSVSPVKPYLHVRSSAATTFSYAFDIEREEFLRRLVSRLK